MANKLKGDIELSLGGKKLLLRPTFEGLIEIEDKAGVGLSTILGEFAGRTWKLKHVAAVIHGGLFHYADEKLSFEKIGKMMVKEGMQNFLSPAVMLLSKSVAPEASDSEVDEGKKEVAGSSE